MNRLWQRMRNIDSFYVLLLILVTVLIALVFYLNRIDKNIRNFTVYFSKVEALKHMENSIERTLHEPFHFVSYDDLNAQVNTFDSILRQLETSDIEKEFGKSFSWALHRIRRDFSKATEYIEDFKTYNARIASAIHGLYDIRRMLEKRGEDVDAVTDVFFSLTRLLMDMPLDSRYLRHHLKTLASMPKTRLQQSFYMYAKRFLTDVKAVKRVIEAYDALEMGSDLEIFRQKLARHYIQIRDIQRDIAVLFFVLALFILLLLMANYRNLRKTTTDLLAFRSAIGNSDNAIVITDARRHIEYVNEAFERITGYTKKEVLGRNPGFIKSGLTPKHVYEEMNHTLEKGEKWTGEFINKRKDGSLLYEKESILPIYINDEVRYYLGIKLDITEYRQQVAQLKRAAAVFDILTDAIAVADAQRRIESVNATFCHIFGYDEKELIKKPLERIGLYRKDGTSIEIPWDRLEQEGKWASKVYRQTKEGKKIPTWLTMIAVRDANGAVMNYVSVDTDLEDIFKMQKRIEKFAFYDRLTMLPNRLYFESNLKKTLNKIRREHKEAALLFMDLDRFKGINDTLGHDVGDRFLKKVAQRLRRVLGNNVLMARMGGDEFVALVEYTTGNADDVKRLGDEILSAFEEPLYVKPYTLTTSISIGIAFFPQDTQDPTELVKFADVAMYEAKENGKKQYRFYDTAMSQKATRRLEIEQALRQALIKREFYLVYQPQVNLHSGDVESVEALIRWESPVLGNVPPDVFVDVAEETGMIVDIGRWVIDEVCKAYRRWIDAGITSICRISINVSSVQFLHDDVCRCIRESANACGVQSDILEIEITERLIMESSSRNLQMLDELRYYGCRIAVDDFGTGYSSLSYMKRMPIDTIKIDRSFIKDLPSSVHDAKVTRAIIALSKSLGYQVVAEGVETKEQEAFLRNEGCDLVQGYLYAKPLREEDLLTFLQKRQKRKT